jgi:hypothetical protein
MALPSSPPISLKDIQEEITGNRIGDYSLTQAITAASQTGNWDSILDFLGYSYGGSTPTPTPTSTPTPTPTFTPTPTPTPTSFSGYVASSFSNACNSTGGEFITIQISPDGTTFRTSFCGVQTNDIVYGDFSSFWDGSTYVTVYIAVYGMSGGNWIPVEVQDSSFAIAQGGCSSC